MRAGPELTPPSATPLFRGSGRADELLRLLILVVLAKADRPLDAEELADRVAAMMGVPPVVPERGH